MKIKVRGKGFAFRDKYLAALAVLFLSFNFCQGQVLQRDPSYGRHWYRGAFDSVLVIPKDTARIRLVETGLDTGQIRYNRTDSSIYIYTGSGWRKIGGSGGGGSQGFEDVLNVDPDLTTYHTINATDTFRINIGKSYFSMTDSVLILYQERQDGSIRYLQISPEGIKNLITNLPDDAGQEIFTIADADSKAKKTFVNTDIIYPNADSSDVSVNNILWVDPTDGDKIKKGTLSIAGGGLSYSDTGRAPTQIVTGGSLNKVRDSLQANINQKLNISDTSDLSRKQMGAYTFRANNTSSAANSTELVYKSFTNLTYGGTVTWTHSGTAPSGTPVVRYSWSQINKDVWLSMTCYYPTNGTSVTAATFTWPSDVPLPLEPTGTGAADDVLYSGTGFITTNYATEPTIAGRAFIKINSGDTAPEAKVVSSSVSARYCIFNIKFTAQ